MGSRCLVLIGKLLRGLQPRGLFKISSSGTLQRFKNDNCRYGPLAYGCDLGGGVANFHRVVFLALVLLFSWFPASSFATVPSVSTPWFVYGELSDGSGAGLCVKLEAKWRASSVKAGAYTGTAPIYNGASCTVNILGGDFGPYGTTLMFWYGQTSISACPDNSTLSGDACSCSAGFFEAGAVCVLGTPVEVAANNAADDLNSSGDQYCTQLHGITSMSVCSGGFSMRGSSIATTTNKNSDGSVQQCVQGPFNASGFACSGTDLGGGGSGGTAVQDGACKHGKVPGQINGVSVCVTAGTQTVSSGSSGATASGGSVAAPTSGLGPNAPPTAATSDKSTVCTGGGCTTTTTFKDGAGATVGTSTETKPQKTFCVENPGVSICKTSTFSAGPCASSDACDGDAIQCAIAAQAKKTACALNPDPDGSDADYIAAKSLTGSQTGNLAGNQTVTIGAGSFDSTDAIGGGSGCIADKVVVVAGQSVTLPFSAVCGSLELLGNVLMLVSFLLAGRIVVRG